MAVDDIGNVVAINAELRAVAVYSPAEVAAGCACGPGIGLFRPDAVQHRLPSEV